MPIPLLVAPCGCRRVDGGEAAVLVTTASAVETEAFAILYVAAAAFAIEAPRWRSQEQDGEAQER